MLKLLAKDQFIDSLTDEDTKLRIRQQTLEAALELESHQSGIVQYQSVQRNSTTKVTTAFLRSDAAARGYYLFRCSFCATTIRGRRLFEVGVYFFGKP